MESYRSLNKVLFAVPMALAALVLVLTLSTPLAQAGQATLAWDPNTDPDVAGYKVHYGEASGIYTVHADIGNVTTYTVTGLLEDRKYYFAVTAYDSYGNESGYSNEVVYNDQLPPEAPKGLRFGFINANRVTLSWGPVMDPDLAGYRIQYGTASGDYPFSVDAGLASAYSFFDLGDATDYYFVVAAYSTSGTASENSNELRLDHEALPLFAADFRSGAFNGNPNWLVVSGSWAISKSRSLTNSASALNLAVINTPGLATFSSGRIESMVKLTSQYKSAPNAAIMFGYEEGLGYRYVRLLRGGIVIGQAGTGQIETKGIKARAAISLDEGRWYHVRVDIGQEGLVSVYLDHAPEAAATYQFISAQPGKVGFQSKKAKAVFDDILIWDSRILEPPLI
jgi:hypothetical protein